MIDFLKEKQDECYALYLEHKKNIDGLEFDEKTCAEIYPLQYLIDFTPTEDDIDDFYHSESLYLSLVVNMWKFCGYETDTKKILEICRTDENWFKNHTWTKEQRAEYEHIWFNILKKCLGFGDSDDDKNEVWKNITQYSAFGGAFDLDDYSEENYKAYLELVKDISNYEK